MTDRVSLPTLTNGKFTGRALTHITTLTQQATSTLKAETAEALATKADQNTLDNFIGTLTSSITDSEAKTALASTQAAVSAERASREEADSALADRVSALEGAEVDLTPYATKEELEKKTVGMPIFATRAEALEYEMANPGAQALYFDASAIGTLPTSPTSPSTPVATVTDYTYQWLGSVGASATTWTDTKQKLALTSQNIASVSGGAVKFTGTQIFKAPLPLMKSMEQTWVMVYKVADATKGAALLTSTNSSTGRIAFAPSLGKQPLTQLDTWSESGLPAADTAWHVGVIRWYGSATTIRVDDTEKLARDARTIEASSIANGYPNFTIGGYHVMGFNGEVREVRLYDRAISDDEANQLVTSLRSQYGIS